MAEATRLRALLDLSRTLSSSLDLREVLQEFTTRAAELTGATAAELSTYDRVRGVLVMLTEYVQGTDEITVTGGRVYDLAEFPATQLVLDTQKPLQIRAANPDDDAAERAILDEQGQNSLLMLPLVARGETIGLMEVVDAHDRVWNDDRRRVLPRALRHRRDRHPERAALRGAARDRRARQADRASTTGGSSRSSSRSPWRAACARARS